jgi:putative protease
MKKINSKKPKINKKIVKKASNKKTVKKVVKKGVAKKTSKVSKKPMKKVISKKGGAKKTVKKNTKKVSKATPKVIKNIKPEKNQNKGKLIGIVSHYFDKISVAAIKLSAPLKVGDKIVFRDHLNNDLFEQEVTSLQINREPINKAQKGDEVGLKVDGKIHDGNEVYLVE